MMVKAAYKAIYAVIVFFLFMLLLSCQKEEGDTFVPIDNFRVTEIIGQKGGINDYKKIYHYDGNKLSGIYLYRYDKKGEWVEWCRYLIEYPNDDHIIEVREGLSDSAWFKSHKWEKWFENDKLIKLVQNNWSILGGGQWVPYLKYEWNYDGGSLLNRPIYDYANGAWTEISRMEYQYHGNLISCISLLELIETNWDTTYSYYLAYTENNITEVQGYCCDQCSGWEYDKQYILDYSGSRLSSMTLNLMGNDSLQWDKTLFLEYDVSDRVISYLWDYVCCPTVSVNISYEEGIGNFQQVNMGNSDFEAFPWLSVPILK